MTQPFPSGHRPGCTCGRCYDAEAGAYWLGMLGFALAAPAATERAALLVADLRDGKHYSDWHRFVDAWVRRDPNGVVLA